ncbi:MAG: tetratricopeptide repeat protein [Tannerellaceae bacterium]
MSKHGENIANKELENVEEILNKSEQFIERNQKFLIYGLLIITLAVSAFFGIRHTFLLPKEQKASAAIFQSELNFAKDSFSLALKGDGITNLGFEGIIDQYGSTNAGNLAKAYAGICYFKLGDNQKAIDVLKSFSSKDKMISPAITGLIGDCYVNMGNTKEGIDYFVKAAKEANNNTISPEYLKKAGRAYESLGEYNKAVEVYTSVKDNYPLSMDAADIDKYIARAQNQQK